MGEYRIRKICERLARDVLLDWLSDPENGLPVEERAPIIHDGMRADFAGEP